MQAQAYNEATFREPDQDGWQPQHEPIDTQPGCTPDTCLHTRLPLPHVLGEYISSDVHRAVSSCPTNLLLCS